MSEKGELDNSGFNKLNWFTRIGYGLGDCAQNLIYQVVAGYCAFFYSDVYIVGNNTKESSSIAGTIMTTARIIDVIWDPFVGAFVDKHNPRLEVVLSTQAVTYVLLQMLYTCVNVPYGALNASLTRDTHEITMLTSIRMVCANIGGFFVWTLIPIFLGLAAGKAIPWGFVFFQFVGSIPGILFMPFVPAVKKVVGKKNMFYLFGTIAIIGNIMIYIVSKSGVNSGDNTWMRIANFVKSTGFTIITGYMWAIVPEVISYAEYTTGRRIAGIVNALTGMFYKLGNALGGIIPLYGLRILGYIAGEEEPSSLTKEPKAWFTVMSIYNIVGLVLLLICFFASKERIAMEEKETKNVKVTDLFTEFVRNGPLRIIALYFVTAFTCMTTQNTINSYLFGMSNQKSGTQEGIRWLASLIPAIFNVLMIVIIFFYSLTDEKIDEINREIERRQKTSNAEEA
ncbi:putative sugar/Na+ simporter [Neocallimastix californiae]|uniref:Putative sugar/Na+ simporter n=1 Tax=Neocallimastix californiae TaxID=1754190 RepID=A0A1Y2ACT6_9FUNG|nr:putative sugar/Na+ simporter [Neocallimastix californiae]|eukprot:ORY20100.1 putative sugar/Na+ simporter [Neocallimastix californiae]